MTNLELAFEAASGSKPAQLSLFIRSFLCIIFMLWAAWSVYGHYRLLQDGRVEVADFPMMIVRILLICSLGIVLVFVN